MAKNKVVRPALAALLGGLLLFSGLWSPAPASALATVSSLTSPNVTTSYTGNLGIIQVTGMWLTPGQSDDILVNVPSAITLKPWQIGESIDAFVSVPQYNPGGAGQNAFYAGPNNGSSVVQDAYASNPGLTANLISFRLTAAPSSPGYSDVGTVDITLPVVSMAGASPGPINVTLGDSDGLIPRGNVGTGTLVNNQGLQLADSLPAATVDHAYQTSVFINDGIPPYTFAVSSGQLPPGLSLSPTDGTLAGTPSAVGSWNFTVTAKDVSANTVSQYYTLVVNAASVPPASSPGPNRPSFTDIAGSWAQPYIVKLAQAGLVSGFADGTYRPEDPVTRAQFVKMLLSAEDLKPAQDTSVLSKYRDYGGSQAWEVPWLAAAVVNHIISGYPDGTLRPDQTVTRLEAAIMMGRHITGQTPALLTFADRDTVPAWAQNYVRLDLAATKGQGLFGSQPYGFFIPDQALTRAAAAAGVAEYLGL